MTITIQIVNRENNEVERIEIPESIIADEEKFNRLLDGVAAILAENH